MTELQLRTAGRYIPEVMYFYDGEAPVKDGVITLPVSPEYLPWAQRAWINGFRLDPETGEDFSMGDLIALYEGSETAKSGGDDDAVAETTEHPDNGGQSPDSDGLRTSELPSTESVQGPGLDSGGSDRPAGKPRRKRTAR